MNRVTNSSTDSRNFVIIRKLGFAKTTQIMGTRNGIKPGPKRIADSTGKPDRRQRDNKETPGNTPSLKPHKHKPGK